VRPGLRYHRGMTRAIGRICGGVLAACALVATGCGEPLLAETEPRSQYDRYDALRGQRPPAYVTDEFGIDKPNLRGRLLRRD
jgi:hypothetical protein